MELRPVQHYRGAQYPSLADHLGRRKRAGRLQAWQVAFALATLAALMGGCSNIS